jgi:gamma-glutamylcyclotransferase (GGCT)/AIG2-like uncharacterized protein YtfP
LGLRAETARLFLYGTLQPAADTPMARWLADRTVDARAARVPGRLFAIPDRRGWYPALVPGNASCLGTMILARLTREDRLMLDRYEGADYRLDRVRARDASGAVFPLATYTWRGRLPPDAHALPGGDFLSWLGPRRARAFSA